MVFLDVVRGLRRSVMMDLPIPKLVAWSNNGSDKHFADHGYRSHILRRLKNRARDAAAYERGYRLGDDTSTCNSSL
jgi:hypothetical protein